MKTIKVLFFTCCLLLAFSSVAQQQVSKEEAIKAAAKTMNLERGKIGISFSLLGKSDVFRVATGSSYHESRYHYSLGVNYSYQLKNCMLML